MSSTHDVSQGLPQFPQSLWRDSTDLPSFPKLAEDLVTDVAIVGAGITGITAGYLLANAGYKVTLLEAGEIFAGTTGFTSAKISAQHGMIYDDLLKHFGKNRPSSISSRTVRRWSGLSLLRRN